MDYKVYNLDRLYFAPNEPKTMEDVKQERYVSLVMAIVLVILAIGLPAFINLGKTLFEVQPVIY